MRGVVYHFGPCPYLPERDFHAFHPVPNPPAEVPYRQLMDWRFRRSGAHVYMPMCPSCDACRPIRVDVAAFEPRRDQRRCEARNADLVVSWQPRGLDDERKDLYQRYQTRVHGKDLEEDPSAFLVQDGGITGGELHARDAAGRLLAVSVCDQVGDALSSVYCYYDPDERERGLGTFMGLAEIAHCRASGLRWLYLGFLVRGCQKMEYKARFRPHEVLENGSWVRYE
jgi:arginine-tRNA-protein transferase